MAAMLDATAIGVIVEQAVAAALAARAATAHPPQGNGGGSRSVYINDSAFRRIEEFSGVGDPS